MKRARATASLGLTCAVLSVASGGIAYAANPPGSDGTPSATNAHSGAAVSQYDVACYQVSQHWTSA